jgi:hypothetical protein
MADALVDGMGISSKWPSPMKLDGRRPLGVGDAAAMGESAMGSDYGRSPSGRESAVAFRADGRREPQPARPRGRLGRWVGRRALRAAGPAAELLYSQ